MTIEKEKIIVGLSGGVDSSVSCLLLNDKYDVTAMFMKNWQESECPWQEDFKQATALASQLNIPLIYKDGCEKYEEKVFNRFIKDLQLGFTPNPDIWCNEFVKFDLLCELAENNKIATGHYANVFETTNGYGLFRAYDLNKDQSYFLSRINPKILSKIVFPLGKLLKTEVRKIAKDNNLITAEQKESMGICFIGNKKFREFIKNYIVSKQGLIISENNQVLGKHSGLIYYTIGQRQGLGIGGLKNNENKAWYVINKDLKNNQLIVTQDENHPFLNRKYCTISEVHYFVEDINLETTIFDAQIRHRAKTIACNVKKNKDYLEIYFHSPSQALTPGQHLVLYINNQVIASGIINLFNQDIK